MLLVASLGCHTLLLEFNMHCPMGVEFVTSKLVAKLCFFGHLARFYFNNVYFKVGFSHTG